MYMFKKFRSAAKMMITFLKANRRLPLKTKLKRKCRKTSQALVKLSHTGWSKDIPTG